MYFVVETCAALAMMSVSGSCQCHEHRGTQTPIVTSEPQTKTENEQWYIGTWCSDVGPANRAGILASPPAGVFLCVMHPSAPNMPEFWNALAQALESAHPGQMCHDCSRSWHHRTTNLQDGRVGEIFQVSLLIPDVDIVLNNVQTTLSALADAVISRMAVSAVV